MSTMLTDTTSSARTVQRAPAKPAPAPPAPMVTTKPPKVAPASGASGATPGLTSGDRALAKYLASLFGPTHTDAELQSMASGYVNGAIAPQITQLQGAAKSQMSSGADALKQIYDEYAQRMGGIGDTVRTDNAAALQTEQGAGNSLRDYLASEGGKLGADVAGAGAGEPAGSALANAASSAGAGVSALGAGSAGEAAARGYTGVAELNAHGAAAQQQADQLPGLARLEGEQQLGSLAGQVQGNLATEENKLLAQIPGMTTDLLTKLTEDNAASQQAKAQVLNSFYGGALDRNTQAGIALSTLNKDMSVAQLQALASKYGVDTRAASSAASTAERTRHDAALESQAQASYGISVAKLQIAQQKAAQAAANGGLTANDVSRLQREAATDLQSLYNNVPARYQSGPGGARVLVDGTGPNTAHTYQEAINALMLKYPALGPQRIIQMANTIYKPGVGGRPLGGKPLGPEFWKNIRADSKGHGGK